MSSTTRQSPAWKNPRDRMSKHMKRKSSSRCLNVSLNNSAANDDFNTESCPPPTMFSPAVVGRRNPFRKCSPQKKRSKMEEDEDELRELAPDWDDSAANDPFTQTSTSTSGYAKVKRMSLPRTQSMGTKDSYPPMLDFSSMDEMLSPSITVTTPLAAAQSAERRSTTVPLDLRLGTKLRITSQSPFPWMKNARSTGNIPVRISGNEKHDGLKCFMGVQEDEDSYEIPPCQSPSSYLEAASLYWQFPSLPWISLFPRIDSLLKTLPKQTAPPLAPPMIEVINTQWEECFDQLFFSWKKSDRRRFYVACPTFTVLFTKTTDSDIIDLAEDSMSCFQSVDGKRHVAIITPTNMGFRRYLKSEDVDFELCSWKKRRLSRGISGSVTNLDESSNQTMGDEASRMSANNDSNPGMVGSGGKRVSFGILGEELEPEDKEAGKVGERNKENEDDGSDSDESPSKKHNAGDHDWLQEMGVSPRNTLKLRRHQSMGAPSSLASGTDKRADREETGSVVVSGASVQTLYNLLRDRKTNVCRAIAGPHANLPPTLLAATPFLHGQLMNLKKSSQVVKRVGHSTEYVVELDGGPLMPHAVQAAISFTRSASLSTSSSSCLLRVNERAACAGLNGTEASEEWNEMTVTEKDVFWKP